MSHVTESSCIITNLDDAEAAAKRLGGVLRRNVKNMRWYAQGFVDDSETWRSMFSDAEADRIAHLSKKERIAIINAAMSTCDHVISFPNASYDVGLIAQGDGSFKIRWDEYGSGGLMPYMGDRDGGKFMQAYAVEAAKNAAADSFVTETVRPDGTIELEIVYQ